MYRFQRQAKIKLVNINNSEPAISMQDTASRDKGIVKPRRNSTLGDVLDETQGHLILRWDAWRSGKQFNEIGIPATYCLIALFFLVYFAMESFLRHETGYARILLLFALLTIGCFVHLRISGDVRRTCNFIVALLGCLCLFLFYTGGVQGTGPLWYFVFPLVALFIQRLWAGILSLVLLAIATYLILKYRPADFDPSIYTPAFLERHFAIYLAVSLMAFFYAFARTSAQLNMDTMNRDYRNMANTDELTRLPNRRRMTEVLYQEVSRTQRTQKTFAIINFDIDYFKKINDQYGHAAGDAILCLVPEIVRKVLRTPDVCARWGGEEFLILLPETGLDGARRVAERLRTTFEQHSVAYGDKLLNATISLGVSEFRNARNLDECLKQADKNLYEAKAAGRNCVIAS